ncbi:hypothetical protein [Streptomyces sp. GMY02]|nr:hypothetical protein [Streptomyces sp. GMY02]
MSSREALIGTFGVYAGIFLVFAFEYLDQLVERVRDRRTGRGR